MFRVSAVLSTAAAKVVIPRLTSFDALKIVIAELPEAKKLSQTQSDDFFKKVYEQLKPETKAHLNDKAKQLSQEVDDLSIVESASAPAAKKSRASRKQ